MNYKKTVKHYTLILALIFSSAMPILQAESPPQTLTIDNEFLKVIVNNSEQDTGRFAIETTGGNPDNDLDDFQPLVYGRPIPWTSYTTVLIDETPYLFGGYSKKTARRTQTNLNFGTFIHQEVTQNKLLSLTQFDGVEATQTLSFHRNPNSRAKDTVMIAYTLKNTDTVPHSIGARIMLDTKLGPNDGAPFRIGNDAITAEKVILQKDFYDYWQTFDNLSSPNVIAQGTLNLPKTESPTDIRLVNWGTLSDHPWAFDVQEGRPFIREGEFEKDTALSLYWQPVTLQPGESRTVSTLYGLANLSLSPGELSLGLTAPDERHVSNRAPFLIMAYILNSGGLDAHDTTVTFELPKGFQIIEGQKSTTIGLLKAGQTYQLPIRVRLRGARAGRQELRVKVTSQSLDENKIKRPITLLAAPDLTVNLKQPKTKYIGPDSYTDITVEITNETNLKIDDISAQITLPETVSLPDIELNKKQLKTLYPDQTKSLSWLIKTPKTPFHNAPISVAVRSAVTRKQLKKTTLSNQNPASQLSLYHSYKETDESPYFFTEVQLKSPQNYRHKRALITYDSSQLKHLRTSFVSPFSPENKAEDPESISVLKTSDGFSITQLSTTQKTPNPLPIIQFHFKALVDNPDLPKIDKAVNNVIE